MIHNGGFESGNLSGWDTIGDVTIQTASFGTQPKNGQYQAVLTTFDSTGRGPHTLSGKDAVWPNDIEPFLGLVDRHVGTPLQSHFLDELSNGRYIGGAGPERVSNGSAIKQQIHAHAGSQLTVHYNFLGGFGNLGDANDFAFVSLVSDKVLLGFIFAGVETPVHQSNTVLNKETGYHRFTLPIPAAGDYTLGIGVVQVLDDLEPSALCVDKISLS